MGAAVLAFAPGRDLRQATQALRAEPFPGASFIGIDDAVALARAAGGGDLPIRSITMPRRENQPLSIGFAVYGAVAGSSGHGPPQLIAYIDPWRRGVFEVRNPRLYSTGETIMAWQHAVHAGHGLGWVWKILVFLSGLLPAVFTVTGVSMWWIKRRARKDAERRGALAPPALAE
jgi:uncharacterized iron-regulated membrane protein